MLMWPQFRGAKEAARRSACTNNLKNIGVALREYRDKFGTLPPRYVADKTGKPLYSWRVLLLPYLHEEDLYRQFHLDEAWDGPHNKPLLEGIPEVYRCRTHGTISKNTDATSSHYSAAYGKDCAFEEGNPVLWDEITDDPSQTLLVLEVSDADIPWTAPIDVKFADHPTPGDRNGYSSDHVGGLHVLFADGESRFLSENTDPETFRRLMLRNDGETPEGY